MHPRTRFPLVLFSIAAGPERGYGHLVRAGVLADALGVPRQMVMRGPDAAIDAAIRFGWTVHCGPRVVEQLMPDLLVVDDPSPVETARWVRRARRAGIAVATIHDGGSERAVADLVIDGSLMARPANRRTRVAGPAFALLDAQVASRRTSPDERDTRRVLIALGGGIHVRRLGVGVAAALVAAVPGVRVDIAAGFVPSRALPRLAVGCRWLRAPDGLASYLAHAAVVVVGGGVTLYEACGIGCATVAVPVVPAQRPAIQAAARAGAVVAPGNRFRQPTPASIAEAAAHLLADPVAARAYGRRARQLVDGRGAMRVAARLRALIDDQRFGGWRHAA